jgi:hypothetical protein
MSWTDAHNALVSLGYRDQALKIELLSWIRPAPGKDMANDPYSIRAIS